MNTNNICYVFFVFFYCLLSCKDTRKNETIVVNQQKLSDTVIVINKIDSSQIQKKLNVDKEKLVKLFFNSFLKDNHPNYMVFDQIKNNHNRINIKKYIDLNINGLEYPTYLFTFSYENDAPYQSLLLTNKNHSDGLILFEKVINEGEYLRISTIKKNKIRNTQYEIEYYEYDDLGNISGNKNKKDSTVIVSNEFEIKNGKFIPYSSQKVDKVNLISNKWFGTYNTWFSYGEIGGTNAGWELEININKENIIASGNGYQIGFTDELNAVEDGNKLILKYKKNIDGYTLGENMNTEFVLIEDKGKYFVQSEWVDSDILTKPEKYGYKIMKE